MARQIKNCPCYGFKASLVRLKKGKTAMGTHYWRGHIKCLNKKCGIQTALHKSPDYAIRIWNKRWHIPDTRELDSGNERDGSTSRT